MKDAEKKKKHKENCGCKDGKECTCGNDCDCGDTCTCGDDCKCGDECHCHDDHCHCHDDECNCEKTEEERDSENELVATYLNMAQRLQADFENYRRQTEIKLQQTFARGQSSIIEAFLPCLDTFKKAKQSITDKNVLQGVEMIEKQIMETLKSQGVEKINSIGEIYDPNYHNVIAVMKNEEYENDVILDEYEAGYMFKDHVLRYAKVIVNKLD